MSIKKWRPFEDLFDRPSGINNLLESGLSNEILHDMNSFLRCYPFTDIYETKDFYVFKFEVPGILREDITIEVVDQTLTIRGERKEDKEIERENTHRLERYCGSFSRSFSIPQGVDTGKISAVLKDGILELRLWKEENRISRIIPILEK